MPRKAKAAAPVGPTKEEIAIQRVELVHAMCQRFIEDFARLTLGKEVAFGYLTPLVRNQLIQALTPFLESGARMKPNYGEFAQGIIRGDLFDQKLSLEAEISFDDLSQRIEMVGENKVPAPNPPRRVTVSLKLSPDISTITKVHLVSKPLE